MFTTFHSFAALSGASTSRRACFSSRSVALFAFAVCSLPVGLSLTGCTGGGTVSPSTITGTSTRPLPTTATGTTPAASNGTLDLTFSNPSGTNADTSAFHASSAMGGLSQGSFSVFTIAGFVQAGGNLRTAQIVLTTSGGPQPGTTYTIGGDSANSLTFTQQPLSAAAAGTASGWGATSGSFIVDSVTGKTYNLRLVNVTMSTLADDPRNTATGSYTLNGTATVTLP